MRTNNTNSYSYLFRSGGFPALWTPETAFSMAGVASWAFDGIAAKNNGSWFLCHIKDDKVIDSKLHFKLSKYEEGAKVFKIHVWNKNGVIDVPENHFEMIKEALTTALVENGFIIPEEQYNREFPIKVFMQDNYNMFSADYEAARERGEKLKFHVKYSYWMEPSDVGSEETCTRSDQINYFRTAAAERGIEQKFIDKAWPLEG